MDARGKKRIKRNWAELFGEFYRSGLSVKEFCRTNGISPSLFYLRRKDYGNVSRPGSSFRSSDFIQLQRVLPSHTRPAASIVFGGQIELALSNGCDKELVRLLISQLKESSC